MEQIVRDSLDDGVVSNQPIILGCGHFLLGCFEVVSGGGERFRSPLRFVPTVELQNSPLVAVAIGKPRDVVMVLRPILQLVQVGSEACELGILAGEFDFLRLAVVIVAGGFGLVDHPEIQSVARVVVTGVTVLPIGARSDNDLVAFFISHLLHVVNSIEHSRL